MVMNQAYQRIIGARTTITESDCFLVAMSEAVRGGWSSQSSLKLLAMFTVWISIHDEPIPSQYRIASFEIQDILVSNDEADKINLVKCASAVWEWMRLMNIHGGTDINFARVSRILSRIQPASIHWQSISINGSACQ